MILNSILYEGFTLTLTAKTMAEMNVIGDNIGLFSTSTVIDNDPYTYTLVAGTGDTDNASFTTSSVYLKAAIIFDFEVKSSYSIRVRSTNSLAAYVEKVFVITVTDVNPNVYADFNTILARSVLAGVSGASVVSTYSLVYTATGAHAGGVLASNGDIHFVPRYRGQKINSAGVVSTYSLVYTLATAYQGGVLASNGDIHFVPRYAEVGQKINSAGVVSTYSLVYTLASAYQGGVLASNGDIHMIPYSAARGQKISTNPVIPFVQEMCESSFINKF